MERTETSIEVVLGAMREGLRMVALRALGDADAADDAAQETILRVLTVVRSKGLPASYTLESYTFGTLKHLIGDAHRSKKRFSILPRWLRAPDKSPLENLIDAERADAVATAFAKLDRSDRALLRRCFLHGERVVDIAQDTGEPPERIRKRKSRALERLRELVESRSRYSND